jgi:hypothetical protein
LIAPADTTSPNDYDYTLLQGIATVWPSYVIDAFNKTSTDTDEDMTLKKGMLGKNLDV